MSIHNNCYLLFYINYLILKHSHVFSFLSFESSLKYHNCLQLNTELCSVSQKTVTIPSSQLDLEHPFSLLHTQLDRDFHTHRYIQIGIAELVSKFTVGVGGILLSCQQLKPLGTPPCITIHVFHQQHFCHFLSYARYLYPPTTLQGFLYQTLFQFSSYSRVEMPSSSRRNGNNRRRPSTSASAQEYERFLHMMFQSTANQFSGLYSQSINQQKLAFNSGEKYAYVRTQTLYPIQSFKNVFFDCFSSVN